MIQNKNAQIATTLTWFSGFFIIVFILLIFTVATSSMAGKKIVEGSSNSVVFEDSKIFDDPNFQKLFEKVLNSKTSIEGSDIIISDLIKLYLSNEDYEDNLVSGLKIALNNLEYSFYNSESKKVEKMGFEFLLYNLENEVPASRNNVEIHVVSEGFDEDECFYYDLEDFGKVCADVAGGYIVLDSKNKKYAVLGASHVEED